MEWQSPLRVAVVLGMGAIAGAAQTVNPEAGLVLTVVEGRNAINSIPLLRSVTPVVEVRGRNQVPLEGATVLFTLPEHGAGGRFPGDQSSFMALSDSGGRAAAPFIVNNVAGKFRIRIAASAQNHRGEISIVQTNSTGGYFGPGRAQRHWYRKWYVWAILGGAAAGGAVSLRHSPDTVVVTQGPPVIGAPR